jgi:hypothetical protein
MSTFGTLVTRLENHFSTSGTAVDARYLQYLLEWHRRILSMPGGDRFRLVTIENVSIAASASTVILPTVFSRIDHVVDLTHNLPLEERGLSWWRSWPPLSIATGTPFCYINLGVVPNVTQPTGAVGWTNLVSDSAADTAVKGKVSVRLANGSQASAEATLTGTSLVRIGTWTTAKQILDWHLETAAAGTVTLSAYEPMLTTEALGTISPGFLENRGVELALVPTVAQTTTLKVDGQRAIDMNLAAVDTPWIPPEWEHLLEWGARCLEYEKQDDDRLVHTRNELEAELKRFKYETQNGPDYLPVPGKATISTGSNLGPYYPKGRW